MVVVHGNLPQGNQDLMRAGNGSKECLEHGDQEAQQKNTACEEKASD